MVAHAKSVDEKERIASTAQGAQVLYQGCQIEEDNIKDVTLTLTVCLADPHWISRELSCRLSVANETKSLTDTNNRRLSSNYLC